MPYHSTDVPRSLDEVSFVYHDNYFGNCGFNLEKNMVE
jgi:hypothetical protein